MSPGTDAIDARLPPLPIGRLNAETLRTIGIGRKVHFRAGPWVLLAEDGSRVVRIHDGSEPALFVEPPRAPTPPPLEVDPSPAEREEPRTTPAVSRAVVLAAPHRRRRSARRRDGRRPEPIQPTSSVDAGEHSRPAGAAGDHGDVPALFG